MLATLRDLPRPSGGRLVTPGEESELHDELSRIVRENAAAYVKQNPTPIGIDFARVIMPAYFVLFLACSVNAFVQAALHGGSWGDRLAGGLFGALSLVFFGITGVLYGRMLRRNDARRLAGTPGREFYFGPVTDLVRFSAAAWRRRRARRAERRGRTRTDVPEERADA